MPDQQSGLPRPRTLIHPGPCSAERIERMGALKGRHFRLSLTKGRTLHDTIVSALASQGVRTASMTLLGGDLEELSFCMAMPDSSGRVVATYGPPRAVRNARLIFGNATLGSSAEGDPLLHCHAAFRLDDGSVLGGHVLADRAVVGRVPVTVLVTALDGCELRIRYDEETRMRILRPHAEPAHV